MSDDAKIREFIAKGEVTHEWEVVSPSGKYRLEVKQYATRPGAWEVTNGIVYRTEDNHVIADVARNYYSFPYAWAEEHPTGHDYLICGFDYQGQTLIELDTGVRIDHLPESAKKGAGFCWAKYAVSPSGKYIAVAGCMWGFPYEVIVYDFSNPMQVQQGFPEIWCSERLGDNPDAWNPDYVFDWEGERCRIGRIEDVFLVPEGMDVPDKIKALHGKGDSEITDAEMDLICDDPSLPDKCFVESEVYRYWTPDGVEPGGISDWKRA